MNFTMHLTPTAFEDLRNGSKTVEGRIYDTKRQRLVAGDDVLFINIETDEELVCEVTGLSIFASFENMFKEINPALFGFELNTSPESAAEQMRKYYSVDEEKKYGVVGIQIAPIDK